MTTPTTPTTLREWLDEYLAMRRALGFQLDDVERQVGLFLAWLEARGQTQTFTIDDAVRWARLNPDAHPSWWATRLSLVRRFANHLNASGVDVPAIPSGLLPARKPRAVPFIYSQADIDALLAACDTTFTDERIAATVRTVIGLLAATGLRIGEATTLPARVLPLGETLSVTGKRGKTRIVPLLPQVRALGDLDDAAHPLVVRPLTQALLAALLLAADHPDRGALCEPPVPAGSRAIRRAVDVVEAHPEHPWTPADLAHHVGLSVRGLQDGFARHVGASPMAHVRSVRLARAHADLLLADPALETVAAVASRWGFTHFGRFAAAHRREFGEDPSVSLHRDV